MELFTYSFLLFFSVWYSFKNPTAFVCLQLLYYSQFLGFVSTELLLGGVDYGSFLINFSILLPILIKGPYSKQTDKITFYGICFILFFILYGLFKPILEGSQPLIMGIKAGKSFFSYLFFIYLLLFRKHVDFEKVFNCILVISLIFSVLYLVNFVGLRIVPPRYEKGDFIQCKYDSYLAFSIAILIYRRIVNKKARYSLLMIILLFSGICIGGYFSLSATSALILLFTPLYKKAYSIKEVVVFGLVFCLYLGVCYIMVEQSDWYIHLQQSQSNSLISRERYNNFRWNLIQQQLYWGWGFLYKTTAIVKAMASKGYMETFSFIDSGYVDLFGRFGILGTILFLSYPVFLIIKSLYYRMLYPFAFFIFQFLCVNYTWSVFSFPMGIMVLALAYTFIISHIYDTQEYE